MRKTESVKVITPDSPILPAQVMDYRDIKLSQAFGSQFNNSNPLSQFLDGESINFSGSAKAPNPKVTNEGATLGRVLFYDKNYLSIIVFHVQDVITNLKVLQMVFLRLRDLKDD